MESRATGSGFAWGRRKPWIVLGTPLFMLALWQLFVPGDEVSVTSLLGWSALLYLGFTLIDLPHKAWGAELSSDYDERSRVTSWREALSTGGQVLLLAALVGWGTRGVSDAADQLRGIALVVVIALPLLGRRGRAAGPGRADAKALPTSAAGLWQVFDWSPLTPRSCA